MISVIPREYVKNGLDRYVVLNRIAKSVIESRRDAGRHGVHIHGQKSLHGASLSSTMVIDETPVAAGSPYLFGLKTN
jgi:hypothetical protein